MSTPDHSDGGTVADATRRNWVDRFAPPLTRPYLRLARHDRPIGTWLLLLPCLWSIALAGHWAGNAWPDFWLMALFCMGALAMRGAGCTYNDIVDRDFDGQVARTRSRPIPSGQVTVLQAKAFMVFQALVGLAVLLQLNWFSVGLGIASLAIVAIYPFMKRITYWPQVILGFAFNWGALLGWAALTGELHASAFVMYVAGISWTLGYDTIYAFQDKEDDILIGVKSTALKFGAHSRKWLTAFYIVALVGLGISGALAGVGPVFAFGIAAAAGHAVWQLTRLSVDDADMCLKTFRSNRDFGLIILAAIVADGWLLNSG